MTAPRRAAVEQDDAAPQVEVEARHAAPRHGLADGVAQPVLRQVWRRVVAPLAVVALVGAVTVVTLTPPASDHTDVADPGLAAEATFGVGRAGERSPLASAPPSTTAPSPSATPSSPSPRSASASPIPGAVSSSAAATSGSAGATASRTPDYARLAADAGTRYAEAAVNVRTGPGKGFDSLRTIAVGQAVTITERTEDGWQQVRMDGRAGWIKASFLARSKPAAATSGSGDGGSEVAASDGLDTSSCSRASGVEDGLTSRTVKVLRAICNAFPSVKSFGGARGGSGSYHNSGRAVDVMVSGDRGWEVAKWARAHAGDLGVIEVLYAQKIWTTQRSGEGWRGFSDRGSATANHYDHVHISVR